MSTKKEKSRKHVGVGKELQTAGYNPHKIEAAGKNLFDRVVSILEQAKADISKAVNSNMVIAYWLIGREIVEEIQKGEQRAEYGKSTIENLSKKLTDKYGKGFSATNLKYTRMFFQTFSDREPVIRHLPGDEFNSRKISLIESTELSRDQKSHLQSDVLKDLDKAVNKRDEIRGFSPYLSWTHYRTLARVENRNERLFYEIEAEKENWSVSHLERQIHSFLFARLLKSKDKKGVMELTRKGLELRQPADAIKNPYVLDFLGLPESVKLHETKFEEAIIDNLQSFLLELGKGFAFVARQKRISTEHSEFYIDLVFYNFHLKCFVLIDLKTGRLTHQDVGQMDMYVRMFDDLQKGDGDNPTVGLILCAEKDKAIAKYSVLNENRQLFASKYMMYLPTEEELATEIEREKKLIEIGMKKRQEDRNGQGRE